MTVSRYLRMAGLLLAGLLLTNVGSVAIQFYAYSGNDNLISFAYNSTSVLTNFILLCAFMTLIVADVIIKRSNSSDQHDKNSNIIPLELIDKLIETNSQQTQTIRQLVDLQVLQYQQPNKIASFCNSAPASDNEEDVTPSNLTDFSTLNASLAGTNINQNREIDAEREYEEILSDGFQGDIMADSNQTNEEQYPFSIFAECKTEDIAHEDTVSVCIDLSQKIKHELAVWNNNSATRLAERLERVVKSGLIDSCPSLTEWLFLIARMRVIRAENISNDTNAHIAQARKYLTQIDKLAPKMNLAADVEALRASIDNIESGPDVALAKLEKINTPYAIRIRLAILANKNDLDGAFAIIDGRPRDLRWCDLAIPVFELKDRHNDALQLLAWAKEHDDQQKYPQCVVRLASVLLVRALAKQQQDRNIIPHDLSDDERNKINEVLNILQPVLDPLVTSGLVESELSATALNIVWQAHLFLEDRSQAEALARLLYTFTPVHLDIARAVINGHLECPPGLHERLRQDYPDNLDANSFAAAIQSINLGQHEEAFSEARKLIPLAITAEQKDTLGQIFQQIWQSLDGDSKLECEKIVKDLFDNNDSRLSAFNAACALRDKNPDKALVILDKSKSESSHYWLQLRANALLQKGKLNEAVDLFLNVSSKVSEPSLLHQTADLAFQAQRMTSSAECYERLLSVQPDNIMARGNLVSIYIHHLRDLEKASDHLRFLHETEPSNQTHTINLAICMAQLYRAEESLALYDETCRAENPDLRAVLGRAELYLSIGNPDAAIDSLQGFRVMFWDNVYFVQAYMQMAYASGNEDAAHEAFKRLNELRHAGVVDEKVFKMVQTDKAFEMIRQSRQEAKDTNQNLHLEMLKGKMPWTWAARVSRNAFFWDWRLRTQELDWVGDDPVGRANLCIYSTNSFHPLLSEQDDYALLPLECPPQGTRVVADISALITLHKLGLLEKTASYFGEILVPEGYLPTILDDGKRMVLHQRSLKQTAEEINKLVCTEKIAVCSHKDDPALSMAVVDEHGDSKDHEYHLIDLIQPVFAAELIDDDLYQRILKICTRPSGVDDKNSALKQFQEIVVTLSTLETLGLFNLLSPVVRFFRIHITQESKAEIQQKLKEILVQESTRLSHYDLWNQIRNNKHFKFVNHIMPEELQNKDGDDKNFIAFFAGFIAREENIPLLADDRVIQSLMLNERANVPQASFGTDAVIKALFSEDIITPSEAGMCFHRLMQWRYRFIIPSSAILKTFADRYRNNLPGQQLREIAEYVHDCMRDMGLFGGSELKTKLKEPMAMRLYLAWMTVIAEFLMQVWNDDSFSPDNARKLTEWCVREFLPSYPRVVQGDAKARVISLTPKLLFSNVLFTVTSFASGERAAEAIKTIKEALKISNGEYHRIVTDILNEIERTKFQA